MALFEDQFRNHSVHEALSQFEAALSQEFSFELDTNSLDHLDRLRQSAAYVRDRLDGASPVLNSAARLNGIHKGVQNSLNEMNAYVSDGNPSHLANASNHIDNAISNSGTLAMLDGATVGVKASDAVSFKTLAEKAINDLNSAVSSGAERQSEINTQSAEIESKLESVTVQLQTLESGIDAKLEELDSRFESKETDRQSAFAKSEKTRAQTFNEKQTKASESSAALLKAIEEKKAEAERIVHLVGNIGLTGNYRGAGQSEKDAADKLRNIALVFYVGMALIVALTLFLTAIEGFNPWQSLIRLAAAAILLIPGTYAAKESSRHRLLENRHRRAELELASINAYVEDLPPEKRTEIKAELTAKLFGQALPTESQSRPDISNNNIIDLLKEAIKSLGRK